MAARPTGYDGHGDGTDTMDIEAQRSGDEGDNEDDDLADGPQSPMSDFGSPPPQMPPQGWAAEVKSKRSRGEMRAPEGRSPEEAQARTRISALMNPVRD